MLDESVFYDENSNIKLWRKEEQDIYFVNHETKKINLILSESSSKIVHYIISYDSTNEESFKWFMAELFNKLSSQEKEKFVFFMDNHSPHSNGKLILFL